MSSSTDSNTRSDFAVLPESVGGGPHGLGDPNDQSLRKVEKEIVIPQKIKEKAKKLKCPNEVRDFGECAKEQGLLMPFKCRTAAENLKLCLESAYVDQAFIDLCTEEYLKERSEYRRTGIKTKAGKQKTAT